MGPGKAEFLPRHWASYRCTGMARTYIRCPTSYLQCCKVWLFYINFFLIKWFSLVTSYISYCLWYYTKVSYVHSLMLILCMCKETLPQVGICPLPPPPLVLYLCRRWWCAAMMHNVWVKTQLHPGPLLLTFA